MIFLPLLVLFWTLVSVLIIKGTASCNESKEAILPETGACIQGELFVSDEGTCWMPTLHKGKKVGQRSSKGFTYTDEAINLLAGDSKPRHRPFPRQVTIDL